MVQLYQNFIPMPKNVKKSTKKLLDQLHHIPSLQETINRLASEGKLSRERQEYIRNHLQEWVADSKYILLNLAIHLSIGLFRFTALPFPLPIGSTLRGIWVMANRMYCNLRWDMHRKRVHSIPVLLFALIPFLGYFAYTIPLKKKSEYLAYLYAQHISYLMYDESFEEKMAEMPRFIRNFGFALILPSEYRKKRGKE